MGFSRQEYWSELPFPPPGDLPDPGIETVSLTSPALAGGFFTTNTTREATKRARRHVHWRLHRKDAQQLRLASTAHLDTRRPSADCVRQCRMLCSLPAPPTPCLPQFGDPGSGSSCIFYVSLRAAGYSKCLKKLKLFILLLSPPAFITYKFGIEYHA